MATADAFLAALRRYGVRYIELGGWKIRNNGSPFTPRAVTLHDSVTGTMSDQRAAEFCRDGRLDLAGPLYAVLLGRDGVAWLIAWGATNNTGATRLDRVRLAWDGAMPTDRELAAPTAVDDYRAANQYHHGIAYVTPGAGPYTDAQQATMPRLLAALTEAEGWSPEGGAGSLIAHSEATGRKVDPKLDVGAVRRAVISVRRGQSPIPATGGGFLMALSDAEQAEVLRLLRDIRTELVHSPVPDDFPGWPERPDLVNHTGPKTMLDFLRGIHEATHTGVAGVRTPGHVYAAAYQAQELGKQVLVQLDAMAGALSSAEARIIAATRQAVATDEDMTDEQAQAAADRIVAAIVENTPPQVTPDMLEAAVRRVFGDAATPDTPAAPTT